MKEFAPIETGWLYIIFVPSNTYKKAVSTESDEGSVNVKSKVKEVDAIVSKTSNISGMSSYNIPT